MFKNFFQAASLLLLLAIGLTGVLAPQDVMAVPPCNQAVKNDCKKRCDFSWRPKFSVDICVGSCEEGNNCSG